MKTRITPAFDAAFPYAVLFGAVVEGEDFRSMVSCCCERAAEDEAGTRYAMALPNVEVVELRPVPTKGAFGGWRVAPSDGPHKCQRVGRDFRYDAD